MDYLINLNRSKERISGPIIMHMIRLLQLFLNLWPFMGYQPPFYGISTSVIRKPRSFILEPRRRNYASDDDGKHIRSNENEVHFIQNLQPLVCIRKKNTKANLFLISSENYGEILTAIMRENTRFEVRFPRITGRRFYLLIPIPKSKRAGVWRSNPVQNDIFFFQKVDVT